MLFKNISKEKKEKAGHILAALIILIHAYEKYDLLEESWVLFAIGGIVFLCIALMHHRIAQVFPYVDGIFFFIEAIVYVIIAVEYFHKGKKALPWCYVFTAAGYTIAAFIKGKKGKAKHLHNKKTGS